MAQGKGRKIRKRLEERHDAANSMLTLNGRGERGEGRGQSEPRISATGWPPNMRPYVLRGALRLGRVRFQRCISRSLQRACGPEPVWPLPPQFLNQLFHHPVWPRGLKIISRRAVLPNRITNGFEDVSLQFWLREQSGQIPGERVATAALRQMRIARRIHIRFLDASANQSLVAFQDHAAPRADWLGPVAPSNPRGARPRRGEE